jgi:hypothetical protein
LSIDVASRISNASLSGNFAFTFSGYKNGNPIIMAGAFTAGGDGTIGGGLVDVNDGSGELNDPSQCRGNPSCPIAEKVQAASSSYDLSGGTGLGTMTLSTLDNNQAPHTYVFAISIASASACVPNPTQSTCGRLIQSDANQPQSYGSGVLKVQYNQAFSITKFFPGQFALLISGVDPNGKRYAGAGAMATNSITLVDIDCNSNGWGLTNGCPTDVNDNGAAAQSPIRGSFSADLDPNYGRGNFLNLAFPNDPNNLCIGPPNGSDCGYAYYVVNQQEMILISSDPLSRPANLTLWTAYKQARSATGWSLATLNKTYATELNALAPNSGNPVPDITAGLLHTDGAGNGTFNYDENQGGTLSQQSSAGTYAIDSIGQKTGRMTLDGFTPFGAGVMYMVQPGTPGYAAAFLVGGIAGGTQDPEVTSGVLEQQSAGPFTNTSLIGSYGGGTIWPVLSGVTNSATFLFADGGGNITANQDTSGPSGPATDDLTLSYQVDSTGRAVVRQNGTQFGILYVVSPTKVVFVPGGSAPALNVLTSGPDNN